MEKIPSVYIGETPLRLSADHGPYHDANGKLLVGRDILPGHTLMMPAEEVLGMTIWHDPRGILDSEKIGVGRMVKPEHQGLDLDTLQATGYEFHGGRSDFISVEQFNKDAANAVKKALPQTTPQTTPPALSTPALSSTPKPIWTTTPTPTPVQSTTSAGNNEGDISAKSEVTE